MRTLTLALGTALGLLAGAALAETPEQTLHAYVTQAVHEQPGFQPSAQRGEAFYRQRFAQSDKMPACVSCHDKPTAPGRHAVTGKEIPPLATHANSERFTRPAKVEKWFGRNCQEVVGRACTAAEKADFLSFALGAR